MSATPRLRRRLWRIIALLAVLAVPWYFPAGPGVPLFLGFPVWAFVSLLCYAAIAALVSLFLPQLWDERDTEPGGGEP